MDHRLEFELARVSDRYRRVVTLFGWTGCWAAVALLALVISAAGRAAEWNVRVPAIAVALSGLAMAVGVYVFARRRAKYSLPVARQIEKQFPDLDHRLLAALEQDRGWPPGPLGYLQEVVVRQAVEHSHRNEWQQAVPASRLHLARAAHTAAVIAMTASLVYLWGSSSATHSGLVGPPSRSVVSSIGVVVEPGDASIERGTDVLVLARFSGLLPADVHVVFAESSGEQRLPLAKSLNDPLFGGRIPSVDNDLSYHVEFDDQRSPTYRITVFDYPDVTRVDAEISYPEYTAQPVKRVEDTRHVTAIEGSQVTLICQLNKPVRRAWLKSDSGEELELASAPQNPTETRVTIRLERTHRYTVHLVDADGRANKLPPEVTLTALPNRPPELAMKFPGRDTRASPLEEVSLQATAWDDIGMQAAGVTYTLAGKTAQSATLGQAVPAKEKRDMQHTIHLEDLHAQPDQLLSYHFWAEDTGPEGKPRRTRGDMFFVEVRPFEEIYRQGEQPSESEMRQRQQQQQQGQSGAAQQAAQLAELQKQIINATWNLIRQTDIKPDQLASDAGVVRDSQQSALEQVSKLAEQAASPNAATAVDEIEQHMRTAIEQLAKAVDGPSADPLDPALAAEQAAYQALLQLRAREHNVVRGQMAQRGQAGQNSANRADRQLQELELDNRENRYETRRTPTPAEQTAAREDNQVLNRLRELARRQEDLNKRIQELQSALQAAREESQREELRRQLERLREEQQDMLRDLDELRNRMDQPENQQRMADARQQLDQTRQNMRQASESLREQQLAPALNSGTRAERDLEQVRDEFRRRTANEFSDEMRSMREDARELANREQDLGDKLKQLNDAPRQSLRDNDRTNLVEQMGEQGQRLNELTEEMKSVSEAAETAEPLLSKQLYDTLRDTAQRNINQSMELTSELMRRGFMPQAGEAEQRVRRDVDEVRKGVERAARGVLGDPAEATRRALEEVEDLSRQVRQEIARSDPTGEDAARQPGRPDEQSGEPSGQRPSDQSQQPGDRGDTEQRPDQQPSSGGQATKRAETSDQQRPSGNQPQGQPGRGSDERRDQPTPPSEAGRGSRDGQPDSRAGQPTSETTGTDRQSGQPRDGQSAAGRRTGDDRNLDLARWTGPGGPITGEQFREWSDRLRDVEEMLENPDLRSEAAEINDRARDVRRDLKRHSKEPNWSMVRRLIAEPLVELQSKLREELARQEPSDKLVPIDRDPVPRRYSEQVRRYYERLGSGK